MMAEIANDFVLQDSSYRLHGHNQLMLNKAAEANQVLKSQNLFSLSATNMLQHFSNSLT
jgi:hypothetical protein